MKIQYRLVVGTPVKLKTKGMLRRLAGKLGEVKALRKQKSPPRPMYEVCVEDQTYELFEDELEPVK